MNNAYRSIIGIFFCFAIFQTTNAGAQDNPESYFSRGVEYSRNGDCDKALKQFTLASQKGMGDPKLHYNIGVCEYKLHYFTEAKQSFTQAGNTPEFTWLANYNIGLIEKASGNPKLAESYFRKVYEHSPDKKLHNLAGYQLGIEIDGGAGLREKSWYRSALVSLGYDDNIVDPAQLASSRGDSFINAIIYTTGLLSGTSKNGINLKLGAFTTRYKQANLYDTNLFQAGIGKTFSAAAWSNEIALDVSQSTLGSNDYLRTMKLAILSEDRLNATDALMLRYGYSNIKALALQSAFLEGISHDAKVMWKTKNNGREIRLSYTLEINNRKDLANGTTFASYSPTRHAIEAKGMAPIAANLDVEGRLNYRISQYADANILSTGQQVKRNDDRLVAAIKIKRVFSKTFELNAEYSYTDNASNITPYSYQRNLYGLGLAMQF